MEFFLNFLKSAARKKSNALSAWKIDPRSSSAPPYIAAAHSNSRDLAGPGTAMEAVRRGSSIGLRHYPLFGLQMLHNV